MNDDGQRRSFLLRLFLDNIGGLIATGAVVLSAGIALERLTTVTEVVKETRTEQRVIATDVQTVKTELAVQKTQIEHLKNAVGNNHTKQ